MRLLQQGVNHFTSIRYQLLFDSREWEWFIRARDKQRECWIILCWFTDLGCAEQFFNVITTKKGKPPRVYQMEDVCL